MRKCHYKFSNNVTDIRFDDTLISVAKTYLWFHFEMLLKISFSDHLKMSLKLIIVTFKYVTKILI